METTPSGTSHELPKTATGYAPPFNRSLPLWICGDNVDSFRTELINISPSGLYCRVPNYIDPYSKLIVTFDLPLVSGDSATIECEGIVVRIEPGVKIPGIQEHRLAIDFCNLDHETTCLLHEFLEEPAMGGRDETRLPAVPGLDRLSAHCGCIMPNVTPQAIMDQHTARMDRLALLGELAKGVAHEIRNPLACIAWTVRVIADETDGSSEKQEIYRELLNQTSRLDGTLSQLLECAGQSAPAFAPLKIENVIDKALLLLADQIRRQKVRLNVCHGFDQPLIQGDGTMLQQAFFNIFLNALEALDEGALTIQTCWSSRSPSCAKKECINATAPGGGNGIIVAIRDTGCGIDPASLVRIFNPFYTTKGNRRGLGLSISHRIIEQHYGSIYVESRPGTGSTFLVCLPTAQGGGVA